MALLPLSVSAFSISNAHHSRGCELEEAIRRKVSNLSLKDAGVALAVKSTTVL
jgi:hypothetical protein